MATFDTLPVLLVSATNESAASVLISELIDNDVTDDYLKDTQSLDRVWRLVNKYYTANVRVHALPDHGRLGVDPDAIEAHVILITEDEVSDAQRALELAEVRAAGVGGAWWRAGVRLLLADSAHEPAALGAWAGRQRADAVALRAPGAAAGEPFAEEGGLQRARSALHAHVWRGLARTDRAAPPPETSAGSSCASDSSACSDSSDSEAEERRAVEHAEAFAAALGALGPALDARALGPALDARALGPALDARALGPALESRAPGASAPPSEVRRDQAEALVLAFCRALGLDPDDAC